MLSGATYSCSGVLGIYPFPPSEEENIPAISCPRVLTVSLIILLMSAHIFVSHLFSRYDYSQCYLIPIAIMADTLNKF